MNSLGSSTFEPDVVFYNYDGFAYGNKPVGYWNSDLPQPYVDTQDGDSSDEKAVTIGSGGICVSYTWKGLLYCYSYDERWRRFKLGQIISSKR